MYTVGGFCAPCWPLLAARLKLSSVDATAGCPSVAGAAFEAAGDDDEDEILMLLMAA
jgi:hypothetical protein